MGLKIGFAKHALVLAAGVFLVASAVPASAGMRGSNGSGTSGAPTGNYLFTYYDIGTPVGNNTVTPSPMFAPRNADNVLRLVEPNGCGNSGTSNGVCGSETDRCEMIYVFDDDQEMGECCGCPITPDGLSTYSVRNQLVNNWGLATQDNGTGTIVVVGSSINDPGSSDIRRIGFGFNGCGNLNNPTCYAGCDPTLAAITTGATNLDGSITHDQLINGKITLTEIGLFDQGVGEVTNDAYLAAQCGALAGNSSHTNGFCFCEDDELEF